METRSFVEVCVCVEGGVVNIAAVDHLCGRDISHVTEGRHAVCGVCLCVCVCGLSLCVCLSLSLSLGFGVLVSIALQ